MPGVYGGELFGNNSPNPYQIFRDQQMIDMQKQRLADQDAKEQRRNDAKVGGAIRSMFDKNHLTTGTGADPVINEMLQGMIEKYSQRYQESKGSLTPGDLELDMQRDMMGVVAYHDNVKVIKSNAMKAAEAVSKQYPGFNKQELYQKAMDRALYKDGRVIQNLEDFDLQHDFVNDVINKDYATLNMNTDGMYSEFEQLKKTKEKRGIVTRDKSGVDNLVSGEAQYIPKYQELTYDEQTGEPKISLRTAPVNMPGGTPYIDKVTGAPVNAIDESTYQEMAQNRLLNARINQLADQRFNELTEKGIQLDESDRQVFRRQAATQQLNSQFENTTTFNTATKQPLPRGHHYRVGRSFEAIPFNIEAAPQDSEGNKDLTGQLGGFTIKDPTNRYGNTNAEIWLTPKGGLLVRSYELNKLGNRSHPRPDQVYYGQAARNFVEANNGWSGNKKADLFKLLDLYDGTGGEPEIPNRFDFNKPLFGPGSTPAPNTPNYPAPAKKSAPAAPKKQKINW
ncbi:MAG: hypothetical protein ACTHMM_26985 [Agriterribacter sp.]